MPSKFQCFWAPLFVTSNVEVHRGRRRAADRRGHGHRCGGRRHAAEVEEHRRSCGAVQDGVVRGKNRLGLGRLIDKSWKNGDYCDILSSTYYVEEWQKFVEQCKKDLYPPVLQR